ncbi:FadR family transcriptional regulator [Solirubrobacter phytolaccae]|uniref:FadR family transcriptional regulator n=1 Tax=Solirubrobacter phytolaccae TaxID=1404360 RepID=A0A9X3SIK9_9ACTN|nr:FadR/GntR family transcriptional regulator [Solirubrobacter phytolaccae]MDA0184352.1 FadR family transcriptional regulator [Solirubrobacter phytolaccae]
MAEFVGEIVGGQLAPGEALPSEVAVAERFGISRGVARECLRALEERGLATVRHGSSTIVNPREAWDLFDAEVIAASLAGAGAEHLLGEYLECRRIIEIEAAGLAAERASEDGVATLDARFAAMEDALSRRPARVQEEAYHQADVAFHTALVETTGNLALLALVRRVDDALLAARYPLARPAYRRTRALPEHQAILDAVRAGDPDAARAAMRAHLDTVEGYLREHARKVARGA